MAFLSYVMTSVGYRRRSSITKWAGRLSRERFDLESPNWTRTSTPSLFTATPDMTSLAANLSKMQPPTALSRISRERLKPGSWHFTALFRTISLNARILRSRFDNAKSALNDRMSAENFRAQSIGVLLVHLFNDLIIVSVNLFAYRSCPSQPDVMTIGVRYRCRSVSFSNGNVMNSLVGTY